MNVKKRLLFICMIYFATHPLMAQNLKALLMSQTDPPWDSKEAWRTSRHYVTLSKETYIFQNDGFLKITTSKKLERKCRWSIRKASQDGVTTLVFTHDDATRSLFRHFAW